MSKTHILILIPFLAACPIPPNDVPPMETTGFDTDGASATSITPTESSNNPTDGTTEPTTSTSSTGDDSTSDVTTGDDSTSADDSSSSSSSTGDDSTGNEGGLDCFSLDQVLGDPEVLDTKCGEHPWEHLPECNLPLPSCQDVIQMIVDYEPCDDIDLCDYILCADALAVEPCDVRPTACDPIIACLQGNLGPMDPALP